MNPYCAHLWYPASSLFGKKSIILAIFTMRDIDKGAPIFFLTRDQTLCVQIIHSFSAFKSFHFFPSINGITSRGNKLARIVLQTNPVSPCINHSTTTQSCADQ
ncbi:hypothetical protein AMECASPLE_018865 [Ameca splendens]|uniref:Uncharacterized protein n=1 Tax=Ameca splendens TaxID=208324 RepID=A0ABV0Z1N7_9TELE